MKYTLLFFIVLTLVTNISCQRAQTLSESELEPGCESSGVEPTCEGVREATTSLRDKPSSIKEGLAQLVEILDGGKVMPTWVRDTAASRLRELPADERDALVTSMRGGSMALFPNVVIYDEAGEVSLLGGYGDNYYFECCWVVGVTCELIGFRSYGADEAPSRSKAVRIPIVAD